MPQALAPRRPRLPRFCPADSICDRARIRNRVITVLPEGRDYQCRQTFALKYLQPRFRIPALSGLHAIRLQDYRLCSCLQPTGGLGRRGELFLWTELAQ